MEMDIDPVSGMKSLEVHPISQGMRTLFGGNCSRRSFKCPWTGAGSPYHTEGLHYGGLSFCPSLCGAADNAVKDIAVLYPRLVDVQERLDDQRVELRAAELENLIQGVHGRESASIRPV